MRDHSFFSLKHVTIGFDIFIIFLLDVHKGPGSIYIPVLVCRDTGPLAVWCVSVCSARNHLPSCLRTIDHCPLCFRQLYETCLIASIYRNTNDHS